MKTLLTASTGGHLAELYLLSKRMGLTEPPVWVTFDTPQSRSLLAEQDVHFAPFAGTRDIAGTAKAAMWARRFLRNNRFDVAVSTGASIALAVLPFAARSGVDCYYVESATRTTGPSVTGRLLTPFRRIKLLTQHEQWANQRWQYKGSVFDGFRARPAPRHEPPSKIVVSLGMHKDYGFRRLLERLVAVFPTDVEVLWQVGETDTSGLNITTERSMPTAELTAAMVRSDVIITHAGMGSALAALEAGKRAILVPRRQQFDEHVDDHQVLLATELDNSGLAFSKEADALQWNDIVQAASWRVEQDSQSKSFVLSV